MRDDELLKAFAPPPDNPAPRLTATRIGWYGWLHTVVVLSICTWLFFGDPSRTASRIGLLVVSGLNLSYLFVDWLLQRRRDSPPLT